MFSLLAILVVGVTDDVERGDGLFKVCIIFVVSVRENHELEVLNECDLLINVSN